MSKRVVSTDKIEQIELVETHNIALALTRLTSPGLPFDSMRWRRALYHAAGMTETASNDILKRIREALELP